MAKIKTVVIILKIILKELYNQGMKVQDTIKAIVKEERQCRKPSIPEV